MCKLVFHCHGNDKFRPRFVIGDFRSIFDLYFLLKGETRGLKVFDLSGNEIDPSRGIAAFASQAEITLEP